jgi:hypothetical protein
VVKFWCSGRSPGGKAGLCLIAFAASLAIVTAACSSSTQSKSQTAPTQNQTTSTIHTRAAHPFRCQGTGKATLDTKTNTFVGDWTHATCTHLGVTHHPFKVKPGSNDRSFTLVGANGDTLSGTSTTTLIPAGPNKTKNIDHLTVTGGTGLFAGATGRLIGNSTTVFLPTKPLSYRLDFTIVGTISY